MKTAVQPSYSRPKSYERDAMDILNALRQGLDYLRLTPLTIAQLEEIQGYFDRSNWLQCDHCCRELPYKLQDSDSTRAPEADQVYVQGIAATILGAVCLYNAEFEEAIIRFGEAQHFFRDAVVQHGEAVAFLAQGMAYHRRNEIDFGRRKTREWSQSLVSLEASLALFRGLKAGLQNDARCRLALVHSLAKQDLDTGRVSTPD